MHAVSRVLFGVHWHLLACREQCRLKYSSSMLTHLFRVSSILMARAEGAQAVQTPAAMRMWQMQLPHRRL